MTYTNCQINPFPSSNPMTSQLYSNNNCGWNGSGFKRCSQSTQVPKSQGFMQSSKKFWDSVHVPDGGAVPMGCEGMMSQMPEYNKDLFQCPDGTVLNVKTGKIVRQQKREDGCWGNGTVDLGMDSSRTWNDREINSLNPQKPEIVGLNSDDLEYNKYSEMKNNELKSNMSQEQIELLQDVENGMYSSKSRLIEESRKC